MTIILRIRARYHARRAKWLLSQGRVWESAQAASRSELLFRQISGVTE